MRRGRNGVLLPGHVVSRIILMRQLQLQVHLLMMKRGEADPTREEEAILLILPLLELLLLTITMDDHCHVVKFQ